MLDEAGLPRRACANGSLISLGFHVPDFGEDSANQTGFHPIQRIFDSAVSGVPLNQASDFLQAIGGQIG